MFLCSRKERNDRVDDSHGGFSLYVKNSLFYKRQLDLEPRNIEYVWVEIILSKSKRILLGIFIDHQVQIIIIQLLLNTL
jgi:hypothetical protein